MGYLQKRACLPLPMATPLKKATFPTSSNHKPLTEPRARVGSHEFPFRNFSLHSHKHMQKEPDSWPCRGCDVHLEFTLDSGHAQWQRGSFRSGALRKCFRNLLKMERKTPHTLKSWILNRIASS